MMYLALGTGIVWFFILGYVYSIFHKINRIEQKVTEMQANGVNKPMSR